MRPPKRIERLPDPERRPAASSSDFKKGRRFAVPGEQQASVMLPPEDPDVGLPPAGEAPSKWDMRTGPQYVVDSVVDLRRVERPTIDLRPSVRIVEGAYYERRSAGFKSRT